MKQSKIRKMTVTAILAAASSVLMFISFSVPFMPPFIKMDFSELPALIAAFALGPLSGAAVSLVKNLINLPFSTTGGVGELSNFILCCAFVVPAGIIYKYKKSRRGAIIGALTGAAVCAALSLATNFYVVYPFYTAFMPMENIIAAYKAINPRVNTLFEALLWFNMPFTFAKCMCSVIITVFIYKKLSPVLKGTK